MGKLLPRLTTILGQVKSIGVLQAKIICERVLQQTKEKTEVSLGEEDYNGSSVILQLSHTPRHIHSFHACNKVDWTLGMGPEMNYYIFKCSILL